MRPQWPRPLQLGLGRTEAWTPLHRSNLTLQQLSLLNKASNFSPPPFRSLGRVTQPNSTAGMSGREKLSPGATANTGGSLATTIIHVDGKPYLLHGEAVAILGASVKDCDFLPATYFDVNTITSEGALNTFEARLEVDDVWSKGFLSAVIYPSSNASETKTVQKKFPDAVSFSVPGGLRIPSGPYVLHAVTGHLYAVTRLFTDQSNSFVRGVVPNRLSEPFRWFDASDASTSYTMGVVPSKLYFSDATDDKPLSGLRFGVKDNIDTAGLQTGNGSKDYRDLYPPREATAPCIQRLLAAGAVMVGKLRCTQWCDGQDPLERFEEITPTNPRGDGWQKPSSSSSGSASACASYSWLDFTVGTDTGGSIRHPAGVNGLFGIRPSLGATESSLSLVCSREFDTVGVFTRSASVASAVSRTMMGGHDGNQGDADKTRSVHQGRRRRKFKLLYAIEPPSEAASQTPKFFPNPNTSNPEPQTPAAAIFESFVNRLETHLGVQRHRINIYGYWRDTRPDPEGTDQDLAKYTSKIYPNLVYGATAHDVIRPFVADFQRAHPDRGRPFIEPTTKARLEYGAGVSDEEMQRSREVLGVFARWVNNVLLPAPTPNAEDAATGELEVDNEKNAVIPLLVYPQAWGQPQYRDEAAPSRQEADGSKKLFWDGFSVYSLSYGSGCPDYVLPLGEVEFTSRITGAKAHLPVAISLLAPKGMDDVLLGLIKELEEAGILREVNAGNRLSL
ncbi:amidase signature enzyme [Apiospora saccharicola]|uniref:Amidase signature enzyme n=1 Tax=Apiospora saccharicola TaxID=335842 RepID=A0ABR1UMF9_9PEZI